LRLVPRHDRPPAVCVVDLVLLSPRHLDDRDAVDSAALTPPRAKRARSGFSHARCRTSNTNTPLIVVRPRGRPASRSGLPHMKALGAVAAASAR
jgi:hypothetical protein